MSKSNSAFGVIAVVMTGLFVAATGLAQAPTTTVAEGLSSTSSSSSSSSTRGPDVITVVGTVPFRTNPEIRAVGTPRLLPDGQFEIDGDSGSSCMFSFGGDAFARGSQNAPYGTLKEFTSGSTRISDVPGCGQSDANFAAGRAYIARNDHSLKDAFAAFDAKDYPVALELFKKSYRKMGYSSAALMIGKMYLYGVGTPKDVAVAVDWFKKAAAYPPPRDIRTRRFVRNFYPDRPEPRYASLDGIMTLGELYFTGSDVPRDLTEARKWFTKANSYDFAPAGDILGQIYQKGIGVPANPKTALGYFKKAAELGYGPSQYRVAVIYYNGDETTPQNMKVATDWFYEASKNGQSDALYAMGRFYDLGEGVTADPQKALIYYKEAALKGQADAQNALGTYFYSGQLVPQDLVVARKWFEHAAMQGQIDAMFNLAAMYYRGEGGEKDFAMAYVWFTLAKASGHPQAEAALKVLEPQLTPEDRAKADAILKPTPAKP